MMKMTAAAGLALALVGGSAFAADLPSRKAAPVYAPPAPVFTWSGLYGGVNIGYGWSASSHESGSLAYPGLSAATGSAWNGSMDINGVVGGGQIGYNYQISPWLVVGVEADIQAADLNAQGNYAAAGFPASSARSTSINSAKSVDWFGTVRGRVGVTLPSMPNLLVYGTGGFAYGDVNHTASFADVWPSAVVIGRANYFDTATGWTAGGGVEWSPSAFPAWSVKVEYLYTDLGATNLAALGALSNLASPPVFNATHSSPTRFNTIRAGLNWHFNPFASAPVLAKF